MTIAAADQHLRQCRRDPAALPTPPFPIVIDVERMTVTDVSGGNWTVNRGAGGTTRMRT